MTDDAYRGLPGAFPYVFRRATSRWFKAYVVLAGALAFVFGVGLALALVTVIAGTLGASALVTLVRPLYVLVGLFVVVPLVAPVLLVARRHRRTGSVNAGAETQFAAAGFGYVAALYLGLVISIPPDQQPAVAGIAAPLVDVMYAAPAIAGVVPPLVGAFAIAFVQYRTRSPSGEES